MNPSGVNESGTSAQPVSSWMLAYVLGIDPDPSLFWHSREVAQGLNRSNFVHPRVDDISDRSIHELDRNVRAAMLREVWQIIAEEQPFTFLYYAQRFVGLRSDVRGFVHHPLTDMYQARTWWLDR